MTLETLIQTHGYWVIFLGTFLEGETILVLGGVAAHQGYLDEVGVIGSAFAGTLLCDQIFFYLGRRHGPAVLARRPAWKERIVRVEKLLARYDTLLILGFRFLYGLRTVTPFVIGMGSGIATPRFVVLNALGAAIWSVAFGAAGYAIGNAAKIFLGSARQYEIAAFAAVAVVGAAVWAFHHLRRRGRARAADAE